MKKILVIDDDKDVCLLMDRFLTRQQFIIEVASNGRQGLEKLNSFLPDLILTDFKLGDMNGGELLQSVKEKFPLLPVIIITGYSDIKVAIDVMKNGAFDYVTKPLFPEEILNTINNALASVGKTEISATTDSYADIGSSRNIDKKTEQKKNKGQIFGTSQASKNLVNQIGLVAPTNFSVIIYGESGAGKEAVAREIHNRSSRSSKPFVAMDCGAISKELAASELFGHIKGSFTGALTDKVGLFEMADGGTIFLDEVANLPYDTQVSLLRVVQERKVRPIGGTKERTVDVRIIVASNEMLLNASKAGKFREDLYYRFNEFEINVPALRHRDKDILMYAEYMLDNVNQELGKTIEGFSDEVVEVFKSYPWFGNIRELKNVVRRAALLCQSDLIKVANLPYELVNHNHIQFSESGDVQKDINSQFINSGSTRDIMNDLVKPNLNARMPIDLKEAAKEAEADMIIRTLREVNFNKSKAAKLLNIDRKTLYNKIKYYNL